MNLLCIHVMNVVRAHLHFSPEGPHPAFFSITKTSAAFTGKRQIPTPKCV